MSCRLLCCVVLSLLGAGHTEPRVRQTPSHEVTNIGQNVILRCYPISNHQYIYWYRQTAKRGMEFMVYLYNNNTMEKADFFKDRFSAEMPKGSSSILKIQPVQLGDSAMYLCASSLATASHRRFLSLHKLITFPLPRLEQPFLPM
ncbi:T-cell receptor beta chain V region CTL-L17 [Fukomys damarensis]|nr:T-cell receptor beta chain V region CTL-L17 [Fukomys damarensis]